MVPAEAGLAPSTLTTSRTRSARRGTTARPRRSPRRTWSSRIASTGPRTRTPPRPWSSWATSGRASPRKPPDQSILCSVLSHVKHGRFDPWRRRAAEIPRRKLTPSYIVHRPVQFLDRGGLLEAERLADAALHLEDAVGRTIVVLFAVEIALLLVLDGRHVDACVRTRRWRRGESGTLGR